MNKVILIGYMQSNPRISSNNREEIVSFEVETKEWWKDKATGQMKSKSDKHLVSSSSPMLINNATKMKKGDFIMLEGKLQAKEWINEKGVAVVTTQVILPNFTGVLKKITEGAFAAMEYKKPMNFKEINAEEQENKPKEEDILQDEIPF